MLHHVQLVVVDDLAEWFRLAQVAVFHLHGVLVQLAVIAHGVCLAIFLTEYFSQPVLLDQGANPGLQVFRIAGEIFQRLHQSGARIQALPAGSASGTGRAVWNQGKMAWISGPMASA